MLAVPTFLEVSSHAQPGSGPAGAVGPIVMTEATEPFMCAWEKSPMTACSMDVWWVLRSRIWPTATQSTLSWKVACAELTTRQPPPRSAPCR